MPILYDESTKVFNLQTANTSYAFYLSRGAVPVHIHYGKKIAAVRNPAASNFQHSGGFAAFDADLSTPESQFTSAGSMLEYSVYGHTDHKTCAFHGIFEDGTSYIKPLYKSHRIYAGKPRLRGLPATYVEQQSEATTLELLLVDEVRHIEFLLRYTVFEELDLITRNVEITNRSGERLDVRSALSMSVDFPDKDFDLIHLHGGWARERQIERTPLMSGGEFMESNWGCSSHLNSPFMALARKNADERIGEVYGFALVYSGNFLAGAESWYSDITRVMMGINPRDFSWKLEDGESFVTPEVMMVFSEEGLGGMSRLFHRAIRTRLVRGKYRDAHRPILINNWEATYFDFNEEKLLALAEAAKKIGVELLVLDDGWFGKRNDPKSSLGDWFENKEKLPNGIPGLAKKVNDLGLKFGLWFEPEMISPDSELYRAHPDWCIHVKDRPHNLARYQMTLDLSRPDVCDYIKGFLRDMLSRANISYVKWDMNRYFSEVGSAYLPADRMQELPHRYMLNLYDILETITTEFPDVLFEGCAGGGGRYDAGMMHYFPQFWCSDDSDAIERLYLQYGTSLLMPACTMGAHVSIVPNHQVNRTTPIETRSRVAMCGTYGFEINLLQVPEEELDAMAREIEIFKDIRDVIHRGDMYRLTSPFEGANACFEYVAPDKSRAVAIYVTSQGRAFATVRRLRFEGLDPNAVYVDPYSGREFGGDTLMNVGLTVSDAKDFASMLYIFNRKDS